MNRTHFIIGLIVVSTLVAPSMFCLIPGATLNPAEMECCHQMMSNCGDVPMEHSCCKSPRTSGEFDTIAQATAHPSLFVIAEIDNLIGIRPEVQRPRNWSGFDKLALQLPPSDSSIDILRI